MRELDLLHEQLELEDEDDGEGVDLDLWCRVGLCCLDVCFGLGWTGDGGGCGVFFKIPLRRGCWCCCWGGKADSLGGVFGSSIGRAA